MKSFKIFFQMRLSNFYSIGMIIGIFTILFSSCSSVKEGSYAYMDDIYVNQYPDEVIVLVDEVEVVEDGVPPANVPGAAYVYQPIPEPTLSSSIEEPYVYSPYTSVYDDFYSEDNYNSTGYYNSLYGSPLPFGVDINFLFFNALSLASYYNYGYYPNNYSGACPSSSSNNNNGSSSSFIAKRFSWNDSANEIIQYLSNQSSSSQNSNSTTNRTSSSRKSRFTNSSTSPNSKAGDGFIKFLSNALENSGNTRSSSSSKSTNSSSGSTRSGSSSKSSGGTYSGKRIR